MQSKQTQLLAVLADGNYHSGENLGELLGVSRAAVWKQLQQLEQLGIEVKSQKGKGYCIEGGLSLLSAKSIMAALSSDAAELLTRLDVLNGVDSTNQYLLEKVTQSEVHGLVCTAEQQTAGRGRRGRPWVSPYGGNIYLSLAWRFSQGVAAVEGLSLAVGVAVAQALEGLGCEGLVLKWPNDVLYKGKKLGGILLELAGDASGEFHVIVGIGLNVRMAKGAGAQVDQAWTDLADVGGVSLERNRIIAHLLERLLPMLETYEREGFSQYHSAWEQRNAHLGRTVELESPANTVQGEMLGVTSSGGLRLQVGEREEVFLGGEISVRAK
ncbi:BirA family transcriptional regulator, biotin operon repressor / biotin-[acetyl-CoA-carboxylase] ligase [Alteromonadaceae bacterium Bs31]|nr:BirA family transcriptional regulator, biotin operon repressor / biotin-[acetyl-CoA-carboxylase] ligase [Alteromonadaceae bacterium Bs31]